MPIERFYCDDQLEEGKTFYLQGGEFHHLARVVRIRPGETVEVVNGRGYLAKAVVEQLEKDRVGMKIKSVFVESEENDRIILAQAFPKKERLDFILEKGTELGVDEFWFFPGDLSIKKDFSQNQIERAQQLTLAAMKQCGRLTLPLVKVLPPFEKWSYIPKNAFFGEVGEGVPAFMKIWGAIKEPFPLIFFVGPESGWSSKETTLFRQRGVSGVSLHHNILRTDTASLVAVSLVKHARLIQ